VKKLEIKPETKMPAKNIATKMQSPVQSSLNIPKPKPAAVKKTTTVAKTTSSYKPSSYNKSSYSY